MGVIPDAGTVRLPKLLPGPVATEVLIAGRRLTAAEALQFGLVNEVLPSPELLDAARAMAGRIAALAPLAVAAILDIRQRTEAKTVQEGLALMRSGEIDSYRRMLDSEDAEEGSPSLRRETRSCLEGTLIQGTRGCRQRAPIRLTPTADLRESSGAVRRGSSWEVAPMLAFPDTQAVGGMGSVCGLLP